MALAAAAAIALPHLQILEAEKHLHRMFGQPYVNYAHKVRRYL